MIPKVKTEKSTTILIEKRQVDVVDTKNENLHVAGGDHAGLIIQKDLAKDDGIKKFSSFSSPSIFVTIVNII